MPESHDIQRGDLVAVVRGHECIVNSVGGIPFTVRQVETLAVPGVFLVCQQCRYAKRAAGVRYVCDEHGNYLPLSWLMKFPPVEEPGTVEDEKTLAV